MEIKIKKLDKSEVEIVGVIPASDFAKYEDKALIKVGERLELQGFRKGKAPASVVKENVQEMELLEEMAEIALMDNYIKILEENKIDAIGRPEIAITKIAKGLDLEFKIVTAVLPEVKLPDYKKIASAENKKEEFKKEIVVDEKEAEKTILELRKMRAEQTRPAHEHKPARPLEGAGGEGEDESEHTKAHAAKSSEAGSPDASNEASREIPESEYPIFDDEFAKSFGKFENAEAFKNKIKENLKKEKETEQKDKLRLSIVEELVKQTEVEIPEVLIQSETDKIMYKLESDVTGAGLKVEDYLKQINKTEANLRIEFKPDAEKRAKLQMIIHALCEKENLKPTEEEIAKDVTQITTMYKDADATRARQYVEQMLENEKVFSFLEKQ